MDRNEIIEALFAEIERGREKYGLYNSPHEAHSVIEEEFDELWDEIKKKQSEYDYSAIVKESIHVAATALRLAIELERKYPYKHKENA